jgi:hypothetical protein
LDGRSEDWRRDGGSTGGSLGEASCRPAIIAVAPEAVKAKRPPEKSFSVKGSEQECPLYTVKIPPILLSKKAWVSNFEQLPQFQEIKMVVWIWPVLSDL